MHFLRKIKNGLKYKTLKTFEDALAACRKKYKLLTHWVTTIIMMSMIITTISSDVNDNYDDDDDNYDDNSDVNDNYNH